MSVFIVVILAATALAVARSLLALRRSEPGLESAGHVNTILGGTGVGLFFLAIGIRMPLLVGVGLPFLIASAVRRRRLLARQRHDLLEAVEQAEGTIELVEALEARRTFIDRVPLRRRMAVVAMKGAAIFLFTLFIAAASGMGDYLFAAVMVLLVVAVLTDLAEILRQISDRAELDRAIEEALARPAAAPAALQRGDEPA